MREDRLPPSVKSPKPRVATRLSGIHFQRKYLDDSASASFGESPWYLGDKPRLFHYYDGLKTYVHLGVGPPAVTSQAGDYGTYGELRFYL